MLSYKSEPGHQPQENYASAWKSNLMIYILIG